MYNKMPIVLELSIITGIGNGLGRALPCSVTTVPADAALNNAFTTIQVISTKLSTSTFP